VGTRIKTSLDGEKRSGTLRRDLAQFNSVTSKRGVKSDFQETGRVGGWGCLSK